MPFIARVRNLMGGFLSEWIGRREHRNPEAVYEAAIQERLQRYEKLRQAAAGVLYMRGKLSRELDLRSAELTRLSRQLEIAVEEDDDPVALTLITRRDAVNGEVERLTAELAELTTEAEAAKKNLIAFQDEILRLRDEKVRMAARLANARARLRLQKTLGGFSADADIRALDAVRDYINRTVSEVQLSRDLGDADLAERLGSIREAESEAAARAQLRELKRSRRRKLLPVALPAASTS